MLIEHFRSQKDAICSFTCPQTHSRRMLQICRELSPEQADTVLCFTFICFSFPVITFQNNTITLGNAQLCRTKNPGSRAEWTLPGCRMGNTALLEEDSAGGYFRNTVNDTKHDTVKRCVKRKFDVVLVCCEGFYERCDPQECSSRSNSLMWGDRSTLWRCGQMTVPWEEICHRQPIRCCRFRVTVQSVI